MLNNFKEKDYLLKEISNQEELIKTIKSNINSVLKA